MQTDGFQVVLNPYWYYTLSLFPGILDAACKIFATWFIAKVCWLIAREVCSASVDRARIKAMVSIPTPKPHGSEWLERLAENLNAQQNS